MATTIPCPPHSEGEIHNNRFNIHPKKAQHKKTVSCEIMRAPAAPLPTTPPPPILSATPLSPSWLHGNAKVQATVTRRQRQPWATPLPPRPATPLAPYLPSCLCTIAIKWPCMAAYRQAEHHIVASKAYDMHGCCTAKPNLVLQHSLCLCNNAFG